MGIQYTDYDSKLPDGLELVFEEKVKKLLEDKGITTIESSEIVKLIELVKIQVPMIIASIRQLIVVLTFERSIKALPIFQLIDVSVPNKTDSCSVFQMVAYGHNTFIKSTSFNVNPFQLVVKFILISNSEETQVPSSMLIVGCSMAFGPAFGQKFASGAASGQNFASGVASGQKLCRWRGLWPKLCLWCSLWP